MRFLHIFTSWVLLCFTHGVAFHKATWKVSRSNDPALKPLLQRRPVVIRVDDDRFRFIGMPIVRGTFKLVNSTTVETVLWGVVQRRFRIVPTFSMTVVHLLLENHPSTFYILERIDGERLRSSWEHFDTQ